MFKETRCRLKLNLCATNVRTGKIKVFSNTEITPDAVMASACLPFMFQAVEIDGEAYWDGGYMGNPAIFPLIYGCESADVVIVHINPLFRDEVPRSADDILNRINEISFNSSLMREMRAVSFVTRLVTQKRVEGGLKHVLVHSITDDAFRVGRAKVPRARPRHAASAPPPAARVQRGWVRGIDCHHLNLNVVGEL